MRYEWQKLRKSKLRLLVVILLACMPFVILKRGYDTFMEDIRFPVIESIRVEEGGFSSVIEKKLDYILYDGITYTGLDAVRKIDQVQHESVCAYTDETCHKAIFDQMNEAYAQLHTKDMIDEEKMTAYYDEHWKEYYEKCKRGELTYEEYFSYNAKHMASILGDRAKDILPFEGFRIYYKDDYTIAKESLQSVYNYNYKYSEPYQKEDYLITRDKIAVIEEHERTKTNDPMEKSTVEWPKMFTYFSSNEEVSDAQIAYLNEKFLRIPEIHDGTMAIALMKSFMDAFAHYLPWITLLFGIVFAPVFNQEYRYQTDQIMRSVMVGNKKQAHRKLALCIGSMMGFTLFTLTCIWLLPHVLIGYHSLESYASGIYSYREQMIMCTLLCIVSMLLYSCILCFLSSYMKSLFSAFLLFLVCIWIGNIGNFINYAWLTREVLSFFPGTCFLSYHYPEKVFTVFGCIIEQGYLMIVLYALLALLCGMLACRHYQRKDVENA